LVPLLKDLKRDFISMKNEPKREKFKRLASKRTTALLNQLRLLGNLSNRANYEYNEVDVRKIFKAVDEQLKFVKGKFLQKTKREFKL